MSERIKQSEEHNHERIPARLLFEYLEETVLGARLAHLLESRALMISGAEQIWAFEIEVEHLFLRTMLPEHIERELLELLDRVGETRLIRVPLPPPNAANRYELLGVGTQAAALRSIQTAWARVWTTVALQRLGGGSVSAAPSREELKNAEPELVTVASAAEQSNGAGAEPNGEARAEAGVEPSAESGAPFALRYVPLPGHEPVEVTAELLETLVQELEEHADKRERRAPPERRALLRHTPALARYLLGLAYNRAVVPADPFAFLGLISDTHTEAEHLREAYLAATQASGYENSERLPQLAEKAYRIERRLSETGMGEEGQDDSARPRELSHATPEQALSAQQLVGFASAPGRARGVVARIIPSQTAGSDQGARKMERPATSGRPLAAENTATAGHPITAAGDRVVVCTRLTVPVLRYVLGLGDSGSPGGRTVAVLEQTGSPLGLGALLAREQRIPCVSSIPDLGRLEDGIAVTVDGDTGLVTALQTGPARQA